MAALEITGSPPVAAVVTLSLDSPLVEHLRRSGAKNPDALLGKLEEQEFDTFEELLNFKSEKHYDMLYNKCGLTPQSADLVAQYCAHYTAPATSAAIPRAVVVAVESFIDVPVEAIEMTPATLPSGEVVDIDNLQFENSFDDIRVLDRTTGERVVAEATARCNGGEVRYKCMCDYQLVQALITALRTGALLELLPTSPLNSQEEGFNMKKLLDVGDIPLCKGAPFMYAAHNVSGKDVYFNIIQRAKKRAGQPAEGAAAAAEAPSGGAEYGVLKEWLKGMLDGARFRVECGGMADPPNAQEQAHIQRYTGAAQLSKKESIEDDEIVVGNELDFVQIPEGPLRPLVWA